MYLLPLINIFQVPSPPFNVTVTPKIIEPLNKYQIYEGGHDFIFQSVVPTNDENH